MDDLLSVKEVQERLKVDRITVYRMIKDGRLSGVKVAQQWRCSRQQVAALGATLRHPNPPEEQPGHFLPPHCLQAIQDLFAELVGVAVITLAPNGVALTTASGYAAGARPGPAELPEALTALVGGAQLLALPRGQHFCAAPVRLDGELVAVLLAGPFALPAGSVAVRSQLPVLDDCAVGKLQGWLERLAATYVQLGRERNALLGRLRSIAALSILPD